MERVAVGVLQRGWHTAARLLASACSPKPHQCCIHPVLQTPGRMGCDGSLLHWERGSGPSERRPNEGMCELLTRDACVLHVVHIVPRPVRGATTTFRASYMMSPMLSLGPHSASRGSGASCASQHTNCDKEVPQIYKCVCTLLRHSPRGSCPSYKGPARPITSPHVQD